MSKKVYGMYFSGTGTTKKMVTYIASELAKKVGYEYEAYDFTPPAVRKEVKSYEQGDIVVLGTPVRLTSFLNILILLQETERTEFPLYYSETEILTTRLLNLET